MRKGFVVVVLSIFMVSFVGCSKETVLCNKSNDEDGIVTTEKVTAVFENKKIADFGMEIGMEFSSEEEAKLYNSYLSTTEEAYESMGMTYNSEIKGKKLIITIDGKMEDILEEYDETSDNTPEAFKEMMSEEGYTCN